MARWPVIIVTATQRFTNDWPGDLTLAQARVSSQYCEAVYRAGGLPMVSPNYSGSGPLHVEGRGWPQPPPRRLRPLAARAAAVLGGAGGLLLTGGGDVLLRDEDGTDPVREMDRDRDFWEAALLAAALERDLPVFGICRGLQLINLFLGGTLWSDVPTDFPGALAHQQSTPRTETSHEVSLEPGSLIRRIVRRRSIMVNSGHHQAPNRVAAPLAVAGRSPDGLIEVLEKPDSRFLLGVQWHPESLVSGDRASESLFRAFVGAARG
jgi:putative glutamine amidotransferase